MKFYLTNLLLAYFLGQSVFLFGKPVQHLSAERILCEHFIDYKNINHETINFQPLKQTFWDLNNFSTTLGTSSLDDPLSKRQPNSLLYLNHEGVLVLTANTSLRSPDSATNILSTFSLKMGHYD